MDTLKKYQIWCVLVVFLALSGCARDIKLTAEKVYNIYKVEDRKDNAVNFFAPGFLTYEYQNIHNRIGRPSASYDEKGREHIYIDTDYPVMYYMVREFSTGRGKYTNYIYRVHFPEVPFSLVPFNLTAGKNVGLIVIVTVDSKNRPLLITSVHTCGCYLAIVPTSHLPSDALPEDWEEEPLRVYGERLPWKIEYMEKEDPKILVYLRPDVHRVMNLEVIEGNDLRMNRGFKKISTALLNIDELERIPIDDKSTSFYYQEGMLKGHVKGSVKLWESILFSTISLDLFVGTDKVYADPEVTGNPFYTSIKPWNRNSSDMWDFAEFLEFWGWKL